LLYSAGIVKAGIGSPKMARKEHVCAPQKSYMEVNFPNYLWGCCAWRKQCSCAVFVSSVRWPRSRTPNSQLHVFVNFVADSGRIASPIMDRFERSFRHVLDY